MSSGWRSRPLAELTRLRFREFAREPEAVFWALAFPVLLAAGLGVAFRDQPPEPLPVAAVGDRAAAALQAEPELTVRVLAAAEAAEALRVGRVVLIVEAGVGAGARFRFDDRNPEARAARLLADRALQRAAGRADPVPVALDRTQDVGSRYIDFLVPGMIGMGIMGNTIWGLGFSIVDARRRKLMKRLVATPMARRDYLASFLIWRVCFLTFEVGVPLGFGALVFGVPLRGSVATLAVIAILGSFAFTGLALLVASRAQTIEGVSGLMNVVMLPMWILSGVFFSADRFPDVAQPVIRALPLTALVDGLRAVMLTGAGWTELVGPAVALAACGTLGFSIALRAFRWR
jgi:ABC-type multidrug transport system permease subunit